jgi:hypothetical protein
MRVNSLLLSFAIAVALTACGSNETMPTVSNAAAALHVHHAGHPTFDVSKQAGGLLAILSTNDTDAAVDYAWTKVGCGPKNEHPCLTFVAGEGTETVPASGPADCRTKGGSVVCPAEGVGAITIVSDANSGGGGDVTLQGGTGPEHPPQCASISLLVQLKGIGNANTWDGCHGQTIECDGTLDSVIANTYDVIKGNCAYVQRKPGDRR